MTAGGVKKEWQAKAARGSAVDSWERRTDHNADFPGDSISMRKTQLVDRLHRDAGKAGVSAGWVLVACLTAVLATAARSNTAAQSRLAALPADLRRRPTIRPRRSASRSGACCSGIRSCPARKTSRARRATIPRSGIPTASISRSAPTASGSVRRETFVAGHPPRLVKRNSQTVLNVAFNGLTAGGDSDPPRAPMFWDLRVRSLEAQALEPIKALEEMRGGVYAEDRAVPAVVSRLNAHRRVPPAVCRARSAERSPVSERQSRARAGGVSADAGGRQYAVRSLHARRDDRAQSRAGPRHGAVPVGGLHQLPQRADVLGLRHARARRARQPEAAGIRFRREQDLRLPHAVAAQPERDGALHAQRRLRDASRSGQLLPADQPRRRTSRRWRRREGSTRR